MKFDHIALEAPEILLPREGIDLTKWAVVACDQYTSQPEYWEEVRCLAGESPSTFHLILPEAFLEGCDPARESRRIEEAMNRYLETGVLVSRGRGFILVERTMPGGAVRRGLVAALDLERYDYRQGSQSLIRATEGTVVDRLPPRVRIRRNAPLELPHIMVLIDDPGRTVIEPLFARDHEPVYDFELMQGGGHIRGWRIGSPEAVGSVARAIERLAEPGAFREKYGVQSSDVLLYAMGDGNHSLATAKEIWEDIKASAPDRAKVMDHPARYALVELVNLHDKGLVFEPIHRVVFNTGADDLLRGMEGFFSAQGCTFSVQELPAERFEPYPTKEPGTHAFSFTSSRKCGTVTISSPPSTIEAGSLQAFLDTYSAAHPKVTVDYIHGDDTLGSLASRPQAVGFYLPAISKHELFRTIILDGVLPRKTFSMGHAHEKRFYLECRKITR
jgi:hypothetical protein